MPYKRLRSGKTIETETASNLSSAAKKRIASAVTKQNISLMKLSDKPGAIEEIKECGYYILRTSHDLNTYFAAVSGKYKLSPVKIELCAFIRELCEAIEPFAVKRGFAVVHNLRQKDVFVYTDAEKLCYSIGNLVLNAMENSHKGGRIRVSVSMTKKFVKITVGDRGCGMDEETVLHCCEPFFSKKSENPEETMGLGLTLARHFASESGGRMTIRSEEEKGTAISLLLPIMERETAGLSVESPAADTVRKYSGTLNMVFAEI